MLDELQELFDKAKKYNLNIDDINSLVCEPGEYFVNFDEFITTALNYFKLNEELLDLKLENKMLKEQLSKQNIRSDKFKPYSTFDKGYQLNDTDIRCRNNYLDGIKSFVPVDFSTPAKKV